MRSKRGLIASIGAATSLILAGTLALASVSTVIAFRGWPGVHTDPAVAMPTVLAVSAKDKSETKRSEPITVASVPVTPSRPHSSSTTSKSHRVVEHVENTPASTSSTKIAHIPSSPVVVADKPASAGSKPAPTSAGKPKAVLGNTVSKVGEGLGNTVQQTGKALGDVVEPVSPTLSQVVTNATDAVGNLVKKATDLVGTVLDSVLPIHRPDQQPAPAPAPAAPQG